MNLNRIILIGRLTADPEERFSNDGMAIAKFRIAVSRRGKPREGQPEADFFNVVCFRQTAEFANRYLRRGFLVAVEGACHIDDYTDRDGNRQRWIEVQADNVQNLTPRGEGGEDRDFGGGGGGGGRQWQHSRDDDFAEEGPAEERRPRRGSGGGGGGAGGGGESGSGGGGGGEQRPREGGGARRQEFGGDAPPPRKRAESFDDDNDDDPFADS